MEYRPGPEPGTWEYQHGGWHPLINLEKIKELNAMKNPPRHWVVNMWRSKPLNIEAFKAARDQLYKKGFVLYASYVNNAKSWIKASEDFEELSKVNRVAILNSDGVPYVFLASGKHKKADSRSWGSQGHGSSSSGLILAVVLIIAAGVALWLFSRRAKGSEWIWPPGHDIWVPPGADPGDHDYALMTYTEGVDYPYLFQHYDQITHEYPTRGARTKAVMIETLGLLFPSWINLAQYNYGISTLEVLP